MHAKIAAYTLVLILALSIITSTGVATTRANDVFVDGFGVAIELWFPEEARPNEKINHTIAANTTTTTPLDIELFVYATVNSTFQLIATNTSSWATLPQTSLPAYSVSFTLPQNTNGTLRCLMRVRTIQLIDYVSFAFSTTQVRSISYSDLLAEYNELLKNHSKLIIDYQNLLYKYNGLLSELDDYHALQVDYNSLQKSQNNYNKLNASYEYLSSEFKNLTDTHESLQENYTTLENEVADLEKRISDLNNMLTSDNVIMLIFILAIVSLVAFVVYIKRKKQEPYLVIRKETVAINEEKKEKGAS